MNGFTDRFSDRLEPLGTATGVFLIVMSLATVVGMPWNTNGSALVSIMQLLGIVGTAAIGAGLIWLARTE
ncbi:hypothetical protein [Halorhabdus sp. BNX81]|uniref:hypothetical protein n=1 Tax=Halorhabdus sp. BNX81 TaxID=2980181 RepID=UPI0023DD2430|nr:hypothetical protein [Halorhabdus sp. BNX81]WEL20142.1 putative membrane protein [Halorhabdus sp. BNX81]